MNAKTKNIAVLSLFSALVAVLQIMSYFLPKIANTFNLSLVLVPIVIGAVLYGPKAGAVLGGVFGLVVTLSCAFGLDLGGAVLWSANALLTALVCMVKGIAAGYATGLVARAFKGKNQIATCLLCAVTAPVVNTGLFVTAMFTLFRDTLNAWAGSQDVVLYVIVGLVGINFIVELIINLIFTPAVITVTKAVKRM